MPTSPIGSLNGSGPKARPKRFFPDEVSNDAASSKPNPATPLEKPISVKRKAATATLVSWAAKIPPELKARLNEMMQAAPRHVLMQDLVEFILTDFFERHPTLPSSLVDSSKEEPGQ